MDSVTPDKEFRRARELTQIAKLVRFLILIKDHLHNYAFSCACIYTTPDYSRSPLPVESCFRNQSFEHKRKDGSI